MTQVVDRGTAVEQDAADVEKRYTSTLETAARVIEDHIRANGRLTRWDYAEILSAHPELTTDDLDIQVARLSEAGKLKQTTTGLVAA